MGLNIYMNKRKVPYNRGTQAGLSGPARPATESEARQAGRLQIASPFEYA